MKRSLRNNSGNIIDEVFYEKCVVCGSITSIKKDSPINLRKNYVDGCGQLCSLCASKFKNRKTKIKR